MNVSAVFIFFCCAQRMFRLNSHIINTFIDVYWNRFNQTAKIRARLAFLLLRPNFCLERNAASLWFEVFDYFALFSHFYHFRCILFWTYSFIVFSSSSSTVFALRLIRFFSSFFIESLRYRSAFQTVFALCFFDCFVSSLAIFLLRLSSFLVSLSFPL